MLTEGAEALCGHRHVLNVDAARDALSAGRIRVEEVARVLLIS